MHADIHNFQHLRVPGSDIDYVVKLAGSLSRKVKPVEGTLFCSPEPGFSIFTADKKELDMHMIDKKGKVIYTVNAPNRDSYFREKEYICGIKL